MGGACAPEPRFASVGEMRARTHRLEEGGALWRKSAGSGLWLLAAILMLVAPGAAQAKKGKAPPAAPKRLTLSLDTYFDRALLYHEQWIGPFHLQGSDASGNAGLFALSGAYLQPWQHGLELGWGGTLLGSYATTRGLGELGLDFEGRALAEYPLRKVVEQVDLIFGARLGLEVVVPMGDLADEINRLQTQGIGAWSAPRLGWQIGASLALRRPLIPGLAARVDLVGAWGQTWLFHIDEEHSGLRYQRYWTLDRLRLSVNAGVEFEL